MSGNCGERPLTTRQLQGEKIGKVKTAQKKNTAQL